MANLEKSKELFLAGINSFKAGQELEAINNLNASLIEHESYEARSTLADILAKNKNYDRAIESYNIALKFNIPDPQLFKNLGMVYYNTNNHALALEYLFKSLEIKPNQPKLNELIGRILKDAEHSLKSLRFFEKELELGTNTSDIYMSYGDALQKIGNAHDGAEFYKKGLKMKPFKEGYSHLLFIMHHDPLATNADFRAIAEECYNTCLAPIKKVFPRNYNFTEYKKTPTKKIRIGFISKRFRSGLADYWALAPLKVLDKNKFEFVFYQDSSHEDHGTEEFKAIADEWKFTGNMNHAEVADLVYQDKIDIFIDLVGHIGGGRLEVFALKPAPIQVCWINYYGTLAMPEMDYFIADSNIITEEAEKYFTETVYKMPDVFNPFTPKFADVKITNTIPAKKNGFITFGSLNRFTKINNQVLEIWAEIISKVKNSKLYMTAPVFREPEMQETIREFFINKGISKDRITIEPFPNLQEFFEKFNQIDILLDPFPFTGGSTTIDSVLMGVPTVTLNGDTWVHRSGYVTLKLIGCEELIANNKEEYLQKYLDLAEDIPRLEKYRQELRNKLLNSPICDNKLYGQNIEKAFLSMYENFIQS